jgi:hypothetical protein
MNELHLQNPAFRNLIYRLERSSETGQIQALIHVPVLYDCYLTRGKGGEFFQMRSTDNFLCEHMNWSISSVGFSFSSFDDFDKMFSFSFRIIRRVDTGRIFNV